MTGRLSIFPLIVTVLFSAACCLPLQADVIEEGDCAEYTFRGSPVNGMGLSSLKDLEGKPVLVEFWGSR